MLAVEIIGATTVFLYGTNLLYDPVIEKPEEDPENPGRPKVDPRDLLACAAEQGLERPILMSCGARQAACCQGNVMLSAGSKPPHQHN